MRAVNTTIYTIADDFARHTGRSFFLTGKAGTGKTTFLKKLRESAHKQMAVVAPTGVAAINAGGVTIHSFFQLPFTPFVPTVEGRRNLISKIKMSKFRRKVLQELELLVVDEISMVRADVLDEVDTVLRHFRFRPHEPFGGVQVIFIGDLYQLAPVAITEEWEVLQPYYRTPYFFDSMVVQQKPLLYLEFDKIFRQSDAQFIHILNAVRDDKLTDADLALLQKQYQPDFDISKHPDYILLTTHNAKADRVNSQEMDRLQTRAYEYEAAIKGEFAEKNYPNNPELCLKKGAKVMFIANDMNTPRRYFNGKIGVVSRLSDEHIFVHCDDLTEDVEVGMEEWKNIRYSVNPETKQIEEEELGTFKQYPLRLAWAITIHKSQGLTFDKVAIDIEAAFTSGQVYVALSRCRSLEGIALLSPLNRRSLAVDQNVVRYATKQPSTEQLQLQLDDDKSNYNEEVLDSIFNFSFSFGQINQLQQLVGQEKDLFNGKTQSFLAELKTSISNLHDVGSRFQRQLRGLYQNKDMEGVGQRIKAAVKYFTTEIDKIVKRLKTSPKTTGDREMAAEYNFCLESLYDELESKYYLISNIRRNFSTKHCFELKDSYRGPRVEFKTLMANRKKGDEKNGKRVARESAPKESTYDITWKMYKKRMSIEEIAKERDLTISTIEGHMAKFVKEGKLSVFKFVSKEEYKAASEFFRAGGTLKEAYDALEGNISYGLLRIVQAAMNMEIEKKKKP